MMTPEHPHWAEFTRHLGGRQGCNFQEKVPGDVTSVTWRCKGGHDQSYAAAILKNMGFSAKAVKESLAYFTEHGGHCDCEILFNVGG